MNVIKQYELLLEDLMTAGHSKKKNFTHDDADKKQLEIGIYVEFEHTDFLEEAEKIALDHLSSVSDYYTKLIKAGLVDEKKALDLYKKYYE